MFLVPQCVQSLPEDCELKSSGLSQKLASTLRMLTVRRNLPYHGYSAVVSHTDYDPTQAEVNATSSDWLQAPAAEPRQQRPPLTLARALLWTVGLLLAYLVYEQLSFWLYRWGDLLVRRDDAMPRVWIPSMLLPHPPGGNKQLPSAQGELLHIRRTPLYDDSRVVPQEEEGGGRAAGAALCGAGAGLHCGDGAGPLRLLGAPARVSFCTVCLTGQSASLPTALPCRCSQQRRQVDQCWILWCAFPLFANIIHDTDALA